MLTGARVNVSFQAFRSNLSSKTIQPRCDLFSTAPRRWTSSTTVAPPIVSRQPAHSRPQDDKPYYITTPIFYVNAAPHVGHLYSMVLSDIYKRYQLLIRPDRPAYLLTGTDEHGMKVQQAAAKAGSDPKSFTDKGAAIFKQLAQAANISNDHFIRTTDADHKRAVDFAWTTLEERGYIYLSKHEGWYSVSDETFYPQSGVHLIVEPATGRKIMASIETGKEVEWTSETNYRFRLSSFKEPLLQYFKENPDFIVPKSRMTEVVKVVEDGLEDLSVSRPSSRLSWGIRVPTDETQTIYVWLDALVNYITKAGYPWTPGKESALGWPADVQIIGKDIVRFHTIYWPAFLIALGLPPPKQVLTHAHWTLGRAKMSKSTGNVVNPFFALSRFGVDPMRFYLAHDGGISDDADYSNEHIVERYRKGLQGGLGNLASRVLRGKRWSVPRAVQRFHAGELGKPSLADGAAPADDSKTWPDAEQAMWSVLATTPIDSRTCYDNLDASGACKTVLKLVYATNAYLQSAAPWTAATLSHTELARTPFSSEDSPLIGIDRTIFLCVESLRLTAIMLLPVMPEKMASLLDMLGVAKDRRTWHWCEAGKDNDYGEPPGGVSLGKGTSGVLFPPLPDA